MPLQPLTVTRAHEPDSVARVRVGIVVSTVGRWADVERLLESIRQSSQQASAIVVANQSGRPAPDLAAGAPNLEVIRSAGGVSRGRNDALRELADAADLIAIPNDHTTFRTDTIERAVDSYVGFGRPEAIAGSLIEPEGLRFRLPAAGVSLNRQTVWRAIEPALFMTRAVSSLGFRDDLGTGNAGPWQAGEGTDLLMRAMARGYRVVAAPDVIVHGRGESQRLTAQERRTKLRSYSRGTGCVLRLNEAGVWESLVYVLSPVGRLGKPPPNGIRPSVRDTAGTIVGRAEGRLGACLRLQDARLSPESLRK